MGTEQHKCPECGLPFTSRKRMRMHQAMKHDPDEANPSTPSTEGSHESRQAAAPRAPKQRAARGTDGGKRSAARDEGGDGFDYLDL